MAISPVDELRQSLAKLFHTSEYSDLTVRCGKEVFNVHRAIVCPRSEFFAAARGSGEKGVSSGEIIIENEDPALIKCMFKYLYTLDYSIDPAELAAADTASNEASIGEPVDDTNEGRPDISILAGLAVHENGDILDAQGRLVGELVEGDPYRIAKFGYTCNATGQIVNVTGRLLGHAQTLSTSSKAKPATAAPIPSSSLALHAAVHAIGEKFGIPGLAELAKERFVAEINSAGNSLALVKALEPLYKEGAKNHNGLRKLVVQTLLRNLDSLEKPEAQDALFKINGLAFDVLKSGFLKSDILYYLKYRV